MITMHISRSCRASSRSRVSSLLPSLMQTISLVLSCRMVPPMTTHARSYRDHVGTSPASQDVVVFGYDRMQTSIRPIDGLLAQALMDCPRTNSSSVTWLRTPQLFSGLVSVGSTYPTFSSSRKSQRKSWLNIKELRAIWQDLL